MSYKDLENDVLDELELDTEDDEEDQEFKEEIPKEVLNSLQSPFIRDIKIANVVALAHFRNSAIPASHVMAYNKNAIYDEKTKSIIFRLSLPRVNMIQIFPETGSVNIKGAKSVQAARTAAIMYVYFNCSNSPRTAVALTQSTGIAITFNPKKDFEVNNIIATLQLGFSINVEKFKLETLDLGQDIKTFDMCAACRRSANTDTLIADKEVYHRDCFKCDTCNTTLHPTEFSKHDRKIYCEAHAPPADENSKYSSFCLIVIEPKKPKLAKKKK